MMNQQILRELSGKLDTAVGLLKDIHQAIGPPSPPEALQGSGLIEISGMQAPWVLSGLKWEGKSEIYDEEELKAFLGFNPNGQDPDGKSWCAGFWLRILQELGIDTTGLDLSVLSFKNSSAFYECDMVNGAFLVFQPKQGSKYSISHLGVKVDDDKLFGGNQGDSAKKSNLAWYLEHAELIACLCPHGYSLSGCRKKK